MALSTMLLVYPIPLTIGSSASPRRGHSKVVLACLTVPWKHIVLVSRCCIIFLTVSWFFLLFISCSYLLPQIHSLSVHHLWFCNFHKYMKQWLDNSEMHTTHVLTVLNQPFTAHYFFPAISFHCYITYLPLLC